MAHRQLLLRRGVLVDEYERHSFLLDTEADQVRPLAVGRLKGASDGDAVD
jgi:hypothetical protein